MYDSVVSTREGRLLRWYRRHRRPLPWRETPDAYRIWVSELMLQQTQVKTVLPYFKKFIGRFPDVKHLARASEQEVLAAWSGLGYYRRARSLHRAARIIVNEMGGVFPRELEGWTALPGVGRYTAGAIVSIAFGKRAPILDGNVARVLSRLYSVPGDPRRSATNRRLWALAEEILPRRSISDFNQALMELGALVCTPKKPKCLVCPLVSDCKARDQGIEEQLPELPARSAPVAVTMIATVVEDDGRVLLYRRQGVELMKDLWELPSAEVPEGEEPRSFMVREVREKYGLDVVPRHELERIRHSIMNRRITLHAYISELRRRPRETDACRWVMPHELDAFPVSSMMRKVLRAVSESGGRGAPGRVVRKRATTPLARSLGPTDGAGGK
jgi:A/G-specific adenine glycosylase